MASPSLIRSTTRQGAWVCARCTLRSSKVTSSKTTQRWIGQKYLAKVSLAETEWQKKAKLIHAGGQKHMLDILDERGLIHQIAGDREALKNLMTNKRVGAYVGIDPTASSLHVGHLLPLMSLFWMYVHGYHTVSVLGGATAKIGDPSGRLQSREKEHSSIRTSNMVSMHYQLKKLWGNVEIYGKKYGYNWEWAWHRELVNNNAWMNKLGIMEVLQMLGPGVRMGTMMSRDTVKNKMEKGDGMSFAEFTYPLLQAWDWWHMYNTKGIQMQIGGSDQYGNIIAGIDAVKYISTHHHDPAVRTDKDSPLSTPFGFTVPLLTTSSGEKFGKSAGNAIWLDQEQTSIFDLYGFFMRQADADVERYLRLFTFMPIDAIEKVVADHMSEPSKRRGQHVLAREFVELVHGEAAAKNAEAEHRMMFGKPSMISTLSTSAPERDGIPAIVTLNTAPSQRIRLPWSLIHTKAVGRILYAAGLAESVSDGHRLSSAGSTYVGGMPGNQKIAMDSGALTFTQIKTWLIEDTAKFLINDKLLILRRGKHNVRIIEVVSDEEWQKMGTKYPGEGLGKAPRQGSGS